MVLNDVTSINLTEITHNYHEYKQFRPHYSMIREERFWRQGNQLKKYNNSASITAQERWGQFPWLSGKVFEVIIIEN